MTTVTFSPTGGFHGNSPFCLGEDEEVEIEVQEDFLSFSADLVAEQLTYMDAVRERVIIYYNIPVNILYNIIELKAYHFKIGYEM